MNEMQKTLDVAGVQFIQVDAVLVLLDAKIAAARQKDLDSNSQMIEKHEPGTLPLGKTLKDRQGWCVGCMRIVMLREIRAEIEGLKK